MASPIVTNTSAQLNGATLVMGFSTSLTDAQIKALPTTPVTLVAAPASGYRIKVLGGTARVQFSGGAYTNINTTYCAVVVQVPGAYWLCTPLGINDSTLAAPLTRVTTIFGATSLGVIDLAPLAQPVDSGASSGDEGWYVSTTSASVATVEAQAVQIAADNNGSGVFTGGNSANTLKITLYYAVEPI
jgi:hypothetical protein